MRLIQNLFIIWDLWLEILRKAFNYILCYTLSKYKYYDNVIEPNFKLNDDFNRLVTTEQNTKEDKYGQKYKKQEL